MPTEAPLQGVGEVFQRETGYSRGRLPQHALDWAHQPEPLKRYPGAPRLTLEAPQIRGGASLWQALHDRRSVRRYSATPLTLDELSRLCWAAQGVTERHGDHLKRTAPSAGALYPIETYVVINRVEGVEPGVYHYAMGAHALEQLKKGDYAEATARAGLDQDMLSDAAIVFVWSALFERSAWKYAQRAYRYVYLDAGHIAQNVALAAVGLGLGSCQVGALYDDEVNALIGVDGALESVLYMSAVGRPA
ncbi:MAG: SagB/ThcOx family dehydrogenase [Anaerolineae bacterium]|jgi:SagB-type dehydrogenase family enzyme